MLLKELDALDIESEEWSEKFRKLKVSIQHHVQEEESELFAEAKEDFSEDELVKIAEEFEEAKQQLQQ